MSIREIPKRKERENGDLRLYDKDINNAIRKFAKTKGDSKYFIS